MSPGPRALEASVGDAVRDSLTSPLRVVLQLIALLALVLFVRIDWARLLQGRVEGASDS